MSAVGVCYLLFAVVGNVGRILRSKITPIKLHYI